MMKDMNNMVNKDVTQTKQTKREKGNNPCGIWSILVKLKKGLIVKLKNMLQIGGIKK